MRQLRFVFRGGVVHRKSEPKLKLELKRERKRRAGSGVPHDRREAMDGWVHVTVKLRKGLPSLRHPDEYEVVLEKFHLVKERFGCGLRQFSVISNHMHFLIETKKTADLSRYMQGLQIRLSKALNKLWERRGSVFVDRFFARLCDTKAKIRSATRYVLNNARRHGIPLPIGLPDPYSSSPYYIRWSWVGICGRLDDPDDWPVVRPSCYEDDYHYPHLDVDEVPGWTLRT